MIPWSRRRHRGYEYSTAGTAPNEGLPVGGDPRCGARWRRCGPRPAADRPLVGGTLTGSALSGKLLPGASADWQITTADGTALGDIRYTLQTDRGDLLYVQSRGVRHGS